MKAVTAIDRLVAIHTSAEEIEHGQQPVFDMQCINSGPDGWARADEIRAEFYAEQDRQLNALVQEVLELRQRFDEDVWRRIAAEVELVLDGQMNSVLHHAM